MASDAADVKTNDKSSSKDSSSGSTIDPTTKLAFAARFVPKIILTDDGGDGNEERYRFMNAEAYSSQMCEEGGCTEGDAFFLQYKNPPFAVPLITSNSTDEDNKDGSTTVEETYIMPPMYDENGIKLEGSKNSLLYAYVSDEVEDPDTYERGLRRIVYAIGYPFNGFQMFNCGISVPVLTLNPKCTFEVAPMGRHVGDWEHVTVFVKIIDASQDSNDPENYELYCIYASQHDAYNIGLAKDYYNDESFRTEFDDPDENKGYAGMKKKLSVNLPEIDLSDFDVTKYIDTLIDNWEDFVKIENQDISEIEVSADNKNQAIIYSSFNGHPNHFTQSIFPLFELNIPIKYTKESPIGGIPVSLDINFSGCDVTTLSPHNSLVGDCFLYPTTEIAQVAQVAQAAQVQDGAESKKADAAAIDDENYPGSEDKFELLFLQPGISNRYKWYTIDENNTISEAEWATKYGEWRWGNTQKNTLGTNSLPPNMDSSNNLAALLLSQLWEFVAEKSAQTDDKKDVKENKYEHKNTQAYQQLYKTVNQLLKLSVKKDNDNNTKNNNNNGDEKSNESGPEFTKKRNK